MFHFCVAASVFASISRDSAFVFQQSCFSIYVSALVLQQFAFVLRQFSFVLQHVSASVLQKQLIAINDNLDHLRHLCVAIFPTISPFGSASSLL
jgi:hypothetical protein